MKKKGAGPVILLAEDEPSLRGMVETILTDRGYQVLAAADGAEALELARRHGSEIRLLITDVKMPALDGFDLRERLLRERPSVAILVMSGELDPEIVGEDFPIIRKPFNPSEFLEKVDGLLKASSTSNA